MAENAKARFISIDLNQFKLHITLKNRIELTLHFNSPSRRFYLSVIAFVVNEMKRQGKITSIPLEGHHDLLALLNDTVGGSAGSSDKENLLPRIYRKWQHALPNLEEAPLFKVLGRKKEYDEGTGKTYPFTEAEKDSWANLFEYKGSEENVRLRFAIDKIGASLDDVDIIYEDSLNGDAWERFISSLRGKVEVEPGKEEIAPVHKEPVAPVSPPRKWKTAWPSRYRWASLIVAIGVVGGAAAIAIWGHYIRYVPQPEPTSKESIASLQHEKSLAVVPPLTKVPAQGKMIRETAPKEKVAPPSPKKVSKGATPVPPEIEVASRDKMAFPLPDKPSIAVLPFVNMSGDPKYSFLGDAFAEEIITCLAKLPQIFVIARSSSFTYKGEAVDVKRVGREQGVRYVLEGSVQHSGDRLRITAQLIDAIRGQHLFSERYERDQQEIFAIQDDIAMKIVTALQVYLTEGEQARMTAKGTKNLEAYLKLLQALGLHHIFNKENLASARELLEEAIALDPEYAIAYGTLARLIANSAILGMYKDPQEALQRAMGLAQKGVAIGESFAIPHLALGFLYIMVNKDYEKAITECQLAISLEPGSAEAYTQLATFLFWACRPEEAIPVFKKALRLSPIPPNRCLQNMGMAYRMAGRYEEAIETLKQLIQREPNQLLAHISLAATYMEAGKEDEARGEAEDVLRIDPNFSAERFIKILPYKNQPEKDRYLNALHKAGLK